MALTEVLYNLMGQVNLEAVMDNELKWVYITWHRVQQDVLRGVGCHHVFAVIVDASQHTKRNKEQASLRVSFS